MPRISLPTIVLAAVTLLLAGGCAGSGGGGNGGGGGGGGNAGAFIGTVDMPNSQGTVTLQVEEDGAALGHLLVTSSAPQVIAPLGNEGFPPGYYTILGNVDGGEMDLEGFAGGTPFTATGTLPEGEGQGSITLHIGGSDYTGTITKDTNPAAGGSLTYSAVSGSNAHTATFPDGEISVTYDVGDEFIDVFFSDTTGTTGRSVSFNIPQDVQVGDVLTCSPLHRVVSYNEHPEGQFFPNVWAAVSGTVTITSRSGTHITFTMNNVAMEHETSIGSATGSFVLNGEVHS